MPAGAFLEFTGEDGTHCGGKGLPGHDAFHAVWHAACICEGHKRRRIGEESGPVPNPGSLQLSLMAAERVGLFRLFPDALRATTFCPVCYGLAGPVQTGASNPLGFRGAERLETWGLAASGLFLCPFTGGPSPAREPPDRDSRRRLPA